MQSNKATLVPRLATPYVEVQRSIPLSSPLKIRQATEEKDDLVVDQHMSEYHYVSVTISRSFLLTIAA